MRADEVRCRNKKCKNNHGEICDKSALSLDENGKCEGVWL